MTTSKRLYANNAKTTLASSISTTDTTIQVSDGSRFPAPSTGQFFLATLEAAGVIEVVQVGGRTGNTFTNVTRAQEGTAAANFSAGARIDNRETAGTLSSFARLQDRLFDVASVDLLASPGTSDSNTYITHANDDGGYPIIAIRDTDSAWKFNSHRRTWVTGSATSNGTTTSMISTAISTLVSGVVAGKYLIQFLTGANIGLVRLVTASSTNSVTWTTPLGVAPVIGDQFQIYKSDNSITGDLLSGSDDGLIFSILLSE